MLVPVPAVEDSCLSLKLTRSVAKRYLPARCPLRTRSRRIETIPLLIISREQFRYLVLIESQQIVIIYAEAKANDRYMLVCQQFSLLCN